MSMKTQLLTVTQQRLAYLGYYRLVVDGQEGPGTSNAVIEFKRNHGLAPRDKIGPLTMTAIFSPDAKPAPKPKPQPGEPLWAAEARNLLGTREVRGKGNNPIIMDWAEELDQWYPGDDVPWCGLFVAHCMSIGAPDEAQEFNRLGARAWRAFGQEVNPCAWCIGVFWRTHKTKSGNGHVAFIIGEGPDYYVILGGNQSDNVTIAKIAKNRLLECRGPSGWSGPELERMTVAGAMSRNEA
ncbi:TIGR02594 family protein [uncultured Paraglaciecola sp.]|uniref:NlpC/P60 family protein n=1 Tax=uncultured Paraglaciecola sp. TaxID=1765024 RepID=UPI00262384F4|nr:TIGR02594 family protein [uncultured Paraglaciecola sp.]